MKQKDFVKLAIQLPELNAIQLKEVGKFCIEALEGRLQEYDCKE